VYERLLEEKSLNADKIVATAQHKPKVSGGKKNKAYNK
jgi:hypothetical protein